MKLIHALVFLVIFSPMALSIEGAIAEDRIAEQVTAVVPNVAPWGFMKGAKSAGIIADSAREIINGAGFKMGDEAVYPFARLIKRLETGQSDFGLFNKNTSYDYTKMVPVVEIADQSYVILFKKGKSLRTWQDFRGLDVAVIRGGRVRQEFDEDTEIRKVPVNNYEQMVAMLQLDRVDGVAELRNGLELEINKQGLNLSDFSFVPLDKMTIWLIYSRANYERDQKNGKLAALKESVERLRNAGFFQKTINKYFSVSTSR